MKINECIFAVCLWALGLSMGISTFATESYPGSQAYNKHKLTHESVNAATGTFDYSYPLVFTKGRVTNFQLLLSYRYNKEGMFSLPNGWQLDLDFIKEKSAYIHGQEWLIDSLWIDEAGYASGLRYFNLHGTKFIDKIEAREVPDHKGVFYRYIANHKDGGIKYFSHQGHIVIEKDRFGNFIKFEYEQPVSSLRSARLKRLIDNYGNEYHFDYLPGELILTTPDNKKTYVYFNKYGVVGITNALAQRTEFKYVNFAGRNLLRTIQTPKGLITQISYDTINYIDDSGKKQLPVVNRVEKIDLANNKKVEETYYTHSQDNNFTGYPLYSLSNNGDSLMDSENKAYRYYVEISRSDLVSDLPQTHHKVFYYNYLHLPIEIVTLKNGRPHFQTIHEYAIAPFKYSRSTNYDKPRKTINSVWDSNSSTFIPIDKTHTNYDLYGNKTEEHRHIYDREMLTWRAIHRKTQAYYNDAFGLEKETIRKDEFTGQMIRTTYALSKDNKTHADKIIEYKTHDDTQWKPWQKFTMKHDNLGRKTYSSAQWLIKDQPGPQKAFYTKDYQHDSNSGRLTVKQKSALGSVHTEIQDTRNGNLMKKITPEGSIWRYEYDQLNRLTKEINPLDKATLYTYQDFDKHQTNQIIKETPLAYKVATRIDAAGRPIEYSDYYQNTWRTLSSHEYNGWSKLIKQTNILGLINTTLFDQFERPINHSDHWGNVKRIEYDDAQLTARTYINQHKIMEKESQPWLAKTIHRRYSIFDNLYDPQTHFLEETLEKNGFGQNVKHTSSLIHRHTRSASNTTLSLYAYDPSFNRIHKTITGFDGLQFTRLTQYDLFNNVVKHSKGQTKDKATTQGETDLRQYNADNQLVSVTTPGNITTQYVNDKDGRRIKTIQPDGEEILFAYSPLGQIVKNSWMRGDKSIEITKSYDDDNHLIALSDNTGQTINYSYEPDGKVRSITYPDENALILDYDDTNRVIGRTDFSGKNYRFRYNAADKGLVSEVHVDKHRFEFNYGEDNNNIKGNLISRTSIFDNDGETETHFYYGAFNNVAKTCHFNQPTATAFDTNYYLNARGQLASIANHSHKGHQPAADTLQQYQYDALNRLVNEVQDDNHLIKSINYHYDANNNLITETFHDGATQQSINHQYNQQDQRITSISDAQKQNSTLHYDWNKNGHLKKTPDGISYEYDAQGYLLKISQANSAPVEYHYLPNGLLSKRTTDKKRHNFYHGANKRITAIKDDEQWYSLYTDSKGLQANIADKTVDQFFLSGRNTGGILSNNKDFKTATYTAYGKPTASPLAADISSSLGWNQEFTDPDAQLTYLQRRFYSPDLKMFISRDSYYVDNHYAYANANPISFIDPTGHNTQQGMMYSISAAVTIAGAIGTILAFPTGGASVTLSAAGGVAAGVTFSLSGLSLMGSQIALDAGNKQTAKALQYTSYGITSLSFVEFLVSIFSIPFVNTVTYAAPTIEMSSTIARSPTILGSSDLITDYAAASLETRAIEPGYGALSSNLSSTSSSEPTVQISTSAGSGGAARYIAQSRLTKPASVTSSLDVAAIEADALLSPGLAEGESALYIAPPAASAGARVLNTDPVIESLNTPTSPGAFASQETLYLDMSGANAASQITLYEDMPGMRFNQGLDRSGLEELNPNKTH